MSDVIAFSGRNGFIFSMIGVGGKDNNIPFLK